MTLEIDIQNDDDLAGVPETVLLSTWVEAALQKQFDTLEQTIRIVDKVECRTLNAQYRGKDTPTNVLSFPSETQHLDYQYLGDLVICAPIVAEEADAQGKTVNAHWAHLVVHGMLHLQGLDHENEVDADKMEALEIKILSTLGYGNPYNNE